MLVMPQALIHIDPRVALIRGPLTMAAEFLEISRPWLTHLRLLAQGARAVFRPSPTASQAGHMAWAGTVMDLQSDGLCEEGLDRRGRPERAVPMSCTHPFTSLTCCGERHGCRLGTLATRGGDGHVPSGSHGCGDRRPHTACAPRLLARQTGRIVALADWLGIVLLCSGCANLVNHPLFFRGPWAASFPWTFQLPTMRRLHAKRTKQDMHGRCALRAYLVTRGEENARFYAILCCRAQ